MYQGSYAKMQEVPESYGGTAFRENDEPIFSKIEEPESEKCSGCPEDSRRLPDFLSGFGGIFDGFGLRLPKKIGLEEILLGAIALFLIFSDERDVVLGVLLLALIFID